MQKLRRPATYVLSRLYSTSHALYNTRKDPVQLGKILCDNHDPNKTALKYISSATKTLGIYEEVSFAQLRSLSSSIAQFLLENNLQPNGRVAVLLPKTIELFASSVGIWRAGGCYVPLFTAFAYEAIKHRVLDSGAKFIITDKENRHKLDQIPEIVNDPTMTIITVTSDSIIHNKKAKEFNFNEMYTTTSKTIINKSVLPQDNMILLYTSGTTGKPKAVQVPVHALNAFETYMNYSLYVEPNDIFWNVADPGWAYGMYYNICGTLVTGTTTMFANIPFKPQHVYQILNDHKVTNLTGAPTMYRSIMAEGYDLPKMYNFHLKRVSCAGEALNKPALQFFETIWNLKIREHYGQTEHGMMVCNHHHPSFTQHVPDGSMGTPLPGLRIALVDDNGNVIESPTSETVAQLAVDDTNSPINFFKGYYNSPEKTKERIVPASGIVVSLSGDRARVDQHGMYYYEGRSDDVINSSGFRIGPKEVEDIIMSHPSVRECGVVGKPDDLRGELVVAFVAVKQGKEAGKELEMELQQLVRNRLAKHQYPREIYFVESLPVTEAGKIKRGELRKRLLN